MKSNLFVLFSFVIVLASCEKEETVTLEKNYLKATIDGEAFTIYQDVNLNNDTVPNTFMFSFGQVVANEEDTSLVLQGCLNRNNLQISFPKPKEEVSYTIYCKSNITGHASAFYSIVRNQLSDPDQEVFYTQNLLNIESIEGKIIGEIVIDELDTKNRIIKGHFYFTAYGNKFLSETHFSTGNKIGITNGEFHYQWDEALNLYDE